MPITKSWEELGFSDIEEPRASDVETGPEWFARQSEDVQRQIVGTERLKLIQQGRITVADIPGRRKNPGWRDSINMKSVDQLR